MPAAGDAALPWLGLGLSSNLSARGRPHPYRLWDARPGAFDYVEYSAPLSLSEARRSASLFAEMWERRAALPVLLHPVHLNLYGPRLEEEAALEALSEHACAVGAAWVSNDVAWWHTRGCFFPGHLYVAPPLTGSALDACVAHVDHVQRRLAVPLAIENPAVLARRGPLHVLEFMASLSQRTGAELLLDLGHLLSHQLAHGLPLDAGLERFPLDRVIEIHVAGGAVIERGARRLYVDDHARPVREELFALLERLVPSCPRLRAVTYEGDGHEEAEALADLRRLRRSVPAPGASPRDAAPVRPRAVPSPSATLGELEPGAAAEAWRAFHAGYGDPDTADAGDDPDGLAAERALRALAVAERVDRAFPLTRLLLASDRDGLAAFTASPEFREGFALPARDTPQSFARYARRRVRERADPELATLLAFETWALDRLHAAHASPGAARAHAPRRAGERDEVAGRFPVDLSGVLRAAAELRHPAARERAAGPTPSAILRERLRAAPGRPWRVGIRSHAGRIAVRSLGDQPGDAPPPASGVGAGPPFDGGPAVSSSIRPHAICLPASPEGWLR